MLIAYDLGTTGNKASLHHDDGRLVSAVTVGYGVNFADGGVAEQDPEDWWNAVVQATRTLMARSGADPADVIGLTVSGQMMGAVLLDANYRPVRPAIIWPLTVRPMTSAGSAPDLAINVRVAWTTAFHQSSGSCSATPPSAKFTP